MKKFTKCTLLLAALASSLLFCIYKLRYDRLYNVMQVLEVFGTPSDFHSCEKKNPVIEIAPPTWLTLEPGIQVYSGHCVKLPDEDSACPQVDVLALLDAQVQPKEFLCKFWIEGSTQAILGTFSYRTITEDKSHSSALLSCQSKYTTKVPYGISFFRDKGKTSIPVIPVSPEPELPVLNPGLLICLRPPASTSLEFMSATSSYMESLLFHSLLGVTRFIVYTSSLPHSVQQIAANLQIKSQVQVLVRPWQLDSSVTSEVQHSLLDQDCYVQSKLHALNYILLQPNQILMPSKGANLTETLISTNLEQGPNQIKMKRFCSEYPNDAKASHFSKPVSLLQSTFYHKIMSESMPSVQLVHRASIKVAKDSSSPPNKEGISSQLFVHDYSSCDRYDFSEKDSSAAYEISALRFLKTLPAFMKKFGYLVK